MAQFPDKRESRREDLASNPGMKATGEIFAEKYRVVAVESQILTIGEFAAARC